MLLSKSLVLIVLGRSSLGKGGVAGKSEDVSGSTTAYAVGAASLDIP